MKERKPRLSWSSALWLVDQAAASRLGERLNGARLRGDLVPVPCGYLHTQRVLARQQLPACLAVYAPVYAKMAA